MILDSDGNFKGTSCEFQGFVHHQVSGPQAELGCSLSHRGFQEGCVISQDGSFLSGSEM